MIWGFSSHSRPHVSGCCTMFFYPTNSPVISLALQLWDRADCDCAIFQTLAWIHTPVVLVDSDDIPRFRCAAGHSRKKKRLGPTLRLNLGLSTSSLWWMVDNNATRTVSPACLITGYLQTSWPQVPPERTLAPPMTVIFSSAWTLWSKKYEQSQVRHSARVSDFLCGSTSSYCTNSCVQLLLEELPAYSDEKRLQNWNSVVHASATALNIWESHVFARTQCMGCCYVVVKHLFDHVKARKAKKGESLQKESIAAFLIQVL